eukprot:1151678-Pelagomonas_calceolata.AAC.4
MMACSPAAFASGECWLDFGCPALSMKGWTVDVLRWFLCLVFPAAAHACSLLQLVRAGGTCAIEGTCLLILYMPVQDAGET